MGMSGTLAQRWQRTNNELPLRHRAGFRCGRHLQRHFQGDTASASVVDAGRWVQYLVIQQELNAGAMFAASLMMGRALAPIDVVIANWRSLVGARQSLVAPLEHLAAAAAAQRRHRSAGPSRSLDVEDVVVAAPKGRRTILANIRFSLVAGEALAIVGPSGTGKSSFVRTLIGVWPAARGEIRLDGAALDQWGDERARPTYWLCRAERRIF